METNKPKLSLALADAIKKYPDYDLKFDLDVVIPETAASSSHTLAGVGVDDKYKIITAFIL